MSGNTDGDSQKLLSFTLDGEVYAMDIDRVREVLEYHGVTRVPRVPAHMRGVINLRGNVVPVVDLKSKFGLGLTEQGVDTCVIITEFTLDGDTIIAGCLVDAVCEVLDIGSKQIEPPPKVGTRLDTSFIMGMGNLEDNFIIILDIDRVFDLPEMKSAAGG